ncbi:MAG: cobalamin biosynthesis protein CobQ [Pseudomonadota bacterium]
MNTPTHMLVGAALLAKPGALQRNRAVLIGALVPDALLFVMFGWSVALGRPQAEIWGSTYFDPGWQALFAIGNSIPLLAVLSLIAWRLGSPVALGLSLSALLHAAFDFPLHADDAHMHFWPLTAWRFESPVSYWDPAHYGWLVAPIEALVGLALIVILWRRFSHWIWRLGLLSCAAAYVLVPAFFLINLG